MTIENYRSHEPLYIVIVREQNAQHLLSAWARKNRAQVTVENNRMKLFENRSLNLFQVSWSHGWENVTIWDCWNKRHLDLAS